jgi:hypothetical protein
MEAHVFFKVVIKGTSLKSFYEVGVVDYNILLVNAFERDEIG